MFCGMCEWQKHALCHYFIYNWACYLYWKHPATIDVLIQIRAIFEIDLKTWVHSQIAKYGWNNIERPSAVESTLRFQPILILIRIMVETSTLIQCRKQRHCACILPFRRPLNQRWNFNVEKRSHSFALSVRFQRQLSTVNQRHGRWSFNVVSTIFCYLGYDLAS